MILLITTAILYAIVRAKHDNYLNESYGNWKPWAFIEGGLIAISLSLAVGTGLLDYLFLPVIFAMSFWIVFDMACGLFRVGKLFYFGSGEFDQKMKRISGHPAALFAGKVIVMIVLVGAYYSIQKAM